MYVYVKHLMRGQINGKFNNVTTMTANNNEVVAISNIVITISINKEKKTAKVQKFVNAKQIAQPSLVRCLYSIFATKTFYYSLILFPEIPLQ